LRLDILDGISLSSIIWVHSDYFYINISMYLKNPKNIV